MKFRVEVVTGDAREVYRLHDRTHNDTAARAAVEGLATFMRHGHSQFPFNKGPLTVRVAELDPEADG